MLSLTRFVLPGWAKWAACAALVAVVAGSGWLRGAAHVQAKWDAERAEAALVTLDLVRRQSSRTVEEVIKYVDRVQVVRARAETIIKEVPVYVPVQADTDCVINRGFVRLHDAAARNDLPGAAGDPDAAPSGVALSTVAATVADNYGTCHTIREQLTALQDWHRAMLMEATR